MAQKLIFCFDGTSNDPDNSGNYFSDVSISNVLKMHALFGGKLSPLNGGNSTLSEQHSFYYSGVGTYGGGLQKLLNAMFAPETLDMRDIMKTAHEDIDKHYEEGREIFVFGFSRGAAIARRFAANLNKDGKPVKLLGVFDTVAAVKNSRDLDPASFPKSEVLFEDCHIGDKIAKAVHLVSLDEKRVVFQPTLFNKDPRVTEVWFAGVHSDIGGGYWFDGLSDTALEFMLDHAEKEGLTILSPDKIDYESLVINNPDDDDDDDVPHQICKDDISINPLCHGKMHEQVRTMLLSKAFAPRHVRVSENNKTSDDVAIVHHTVRERFNKVAGYRPYALRDTKYRIMNEDGEVETLERVGVSGLKKGGRIWTER